MGKIILWTADEIQCLRDGKIPSGRSEKASRTKAFKLNIEFHPRGGRSSFKVDQKTEKKIVSEYNKKHNKTHIASKFGLSRNTIIDVLKRNGVNVEKSPHERLGEHIEFEGNNFSWKKGSWICTAKKVRESGEYNLTKILWKRYHGYYPDAGFDIRYKDGNKYNLKKSNLFIVTKSEAQKIRMKDKRYRGFVYANGCMGLLMNKIYEIQDPQRKIDRVEKQTKTRKERHPDLGKKIAESRKQNAQKRGYYYTPETIKKMSDSHKGKPSPNKGKKYAKKQDSKI